jgi:cytidylate kinase
MTDKKKYVITVNGPGSSGKSSAALEVAKALGFSFLSTGNVYRSYA